MIVVSALRVLMARMMRLFCRTPAPALQLMEVFPLNPVLTAPLLFRMMGTGVGVAVGVGIGVAVGMVVGVGVAVAVGVEVGVGVGGNDPTADPESFTVAEDFPLLASLVIAIVSVNFLLPMSGAN